MKQPVSIRRQQDFDRIYKLGRRYRSHLLTVVMTAGSGGRDVQPMSAAYVVSRKVARQAVARNRVRRRLREALRELLEALGEFSLAGREIIIIAHPAAARADYTALREALERVLTGALLKQHRAPHDREAGG